MLSLGNSNYNPVMFGVGPPVSSGPGDAAALNYPGAFMPTFRDSLSRKQDQSHHFAAFLEISVILGSPVAMATAVAIDISPLNGGDIRLGLAAATLGGLLRDGPLNGGLTVSQVGDCVRKNICNPLKSETTR
jgi:hypothetical protein